jgi:hypothetical protein
VVMFVEFQGDSSRQGGRVTILVRFVASKQQEEHLRSSVYRNDLNDSNPAFIVVTTYGYKFLF